MDVTGDRFAITKISTEFRNFRTNRSQRSTFEERPGVLGSSQLPTSKRSVDEIS